MIAAENLQSTDSFSSKISARFNTKNLGEIEKILDIRIKRGRNLKTIYLDLETYLDRVLAEFGLSHSKYKKKSVPISDYNNLRPATEEDGKFDVKLYQRMIGILMYAMTLTRPDIALMLGCLARHMSQPTIQRSYAIKELMRYLSSTIQQKLRFGPRRNDHDEHFVIYVDVDWVSDKIDRKSISGGVGMFYGSPFCLISKKQRGVARSSCESKYIAQSTYAMQGQWTAQVPIQESPSSRNIQTCRCLLPSHSRFGRKFLESCVVEHEHKDKVF